MIGGIAAELQGAKIGRSLDLDVTPAASRANRERIANALTWRKIAIKLGRVHAVTLHSC